jgi:HAD superfamily hydrolase (TIGR01509 family)
VDLPESVSAIVFDCDGLLLDTEPAWSRAEAALFAEHGFGFGPEQKELLIGRTVEAACATLAGYFGREGEQDALSARLLDLVAGELGVGVTAMPGAAQLVASLAGRIPLAVASNSARRLLDISLNSSGLSGNFSVTVAADEVERPKPDPQLYLEAFARLDADPVRGVALEDSGTGATAARASGAFLIAIPSLPGKVLGGDFETSSLADPIIQAWGRSVMHS